MQSADLEASLLLGMATGLDRLGMITHTGMALEPAMVEAFEAYMARREAYEPLQYITGKQEFMSLEFLVTPEVLIPRPETEHLVEAILDIEEDAGGPPEDGRQVVDIGTGSGAIVIALASYIKSLRGIGTDVSEAALEIARQNALKHEVTDRVTFRLGDVFEPVRDLAGSVDYLVSNPPYIPSTLIDTLDREVKDWEPLSALDGGPDGLAMLRRLAFEGLTLLRSGGHLALEVMAGQSDSVIALLEAWDDVTLVHDLAGHPRVVVARAPGGS